jgi:hypothetical protein
MMSRLLSARVVWFAIVAAALLGNGPAWPK